MLRGISAAHLTKSRQPCLEVHAWESRSVPEYLQNNSPESIQYDGSIPCLNDEGQVLAIKRRRVKPISEKDEEWFSSGKTREESSSEKTRDKSSSEKTRDKSSSEKTRDKTSSEKTRDKSSSRKTRIKPSSEKTRNKTLV